MTDQVVQEIPHKRGTGVKLGVLPFAQRIADPDWIVQFARAVETTSAESIWTYEHVAVPADYASVYPFDPSGKMTSPPSADLPDPLQWLQHVAAHTDRVRLGTCLMLLPLHNPLILAKRLATLDRLSKGRVVAGFGIGWLAEEYDALSVPFSERGSRADEFLQILRAVWAPGPATFTGRYHRFDHLHVHPKPAHAGGVPLIIGGHSRAAMRRTARFGGGVFLLGQTPATLEATLDMLRQEADIVGRSFDDFEITVDAPRDASTARVFRELGADRFVLPVPADDVALVADHINRYIAEVLPR